MNIEEARKVLWLKNNPRPLGELLDEGIITEENLNWAANYAYNSTLKQAAQTLLNSTKSLPQKPEKESLLINALPVNITLEKARGTLWPFAPHKGKAMGALLASNQISLKDLGFAVENAWDEKVKQAAITLSLVKLEQKINEPISSDGFVNIIPARKSFSERQIRRLTLIQGVMFGATIATGLILSFASINWSRPNTPGNAISTLLSTPIGILSLIAVIVFLLLLSFLFNKIMDYLDRQLENKIEEYRLGQEGEGRVTEFIIQALDGNWTLFKNIQLPGRNKGDLDLVLIGPPGIWVLEVKNYRGEYRNIGDKWEIRKKKKWISTKVNPSNQAFQNAIRLSNFLKADHINVFVNSVVVWASQESSLLIENPTTMIWKLNQLPEELGNIWQGEKISKDEREKVIEKLSKLNGKQ